MGDERKLRYRYYFLNAPDGSFMSPQPDGMNSVGLRDLDDMDRVTVLPSHIMGLPYVMKALFKLHNSSKLNRIVNLPGKELWFPKYYDFDADEQERICFICLNPHLSVAYMQYLRQRFPNAVFVKLHRDLLCHFHRRTPEWTEEALNDFFDLRFSYDEGDCEEYGLLFAPQYASKVDVPQRAESSDLFFCGRAKDRLGKIQDLVGLLQERGFKTRALIIEADKSERRDIEGIAYLDKPISYLEVLEGEVNSEFILDINQNGASGVTLRVIEACMYGKRLITDNAGIVDSPYYDPDLMMVIGDDLEIDLEQLKSWDVPTKEYDGRFSPINLIYQIDEELTRREEEALGGLS